AGVQVLEQRIPVGALQLVDRLDGGLGFVCAIAPPGGEQGGGKVGNRAAHRLGEVLLRDRVFLLLERVYADNEAGNAVVLVELEDLLGEPDGFLDVALRKHRKEGTFQQFRVLRVATKRGAIIGSRRPGVALRTGVARGEIASGRRQPRQFLRGRRVGRNLGIWRGSL